MSANRDLVPVDLKGNSDMDSALKKKWDGRWDQLKGKVKQTWGDVTDDDCDVAEGQYDELVGRIKSRTGETEEAIQRRLDMD
jgi:uncharacterized protein YjbJ (UPF0337 family)